MSISRKQLAWSIIGVCVATIVVLTALEITNVTHLFHSSRPPISSEDKNAKTTSKLPTAQSNFNGGSPRSATTNTAPQGTVTDTKGTTVPSTPSSDWTSSPGGAIVVYAPAPNTTLHSGDILSGSSTQSAVSYRLIDNVTGQIATGYLSVVGGKFSGTFSFSTKATQGELDVFTQAPNGVESNNIKIPVKFN